MRLHVFLDLIIYEGNTKKLQLLLVFTVCKPIGHWYVSKNNNILTCDMG